MFSRRSGQPTEPAVPAGPQRYRSQAIGHAHERLDSEDRKVEILDLGAACGETLAFYSGLSCRLHFADSYADMKGRPRDEEETIDDILAAYAAALPFRSGTRFDLILTWDLFNYLSREEIEGLTRHLRRFSSDSAPLVSLIWNTPKIPAQPHHYAIIDAETLEYRRRPASGPVHATRSPTCCERWTAIAFAAPSCCATACRSTSSRRGARATPDPEQNGDRVVGCAGAIHSPRRATSSPRSSI